MLDDDLQAIGLTLRLAATSMALLLLLAIPLAWWLAQSQSRWKTPVAALVALPLVLPPTVLGFYLLVLLGPQGIIGATMLKLGLHTLPFTFSGLVLASVLYSLPFAVQPLHNAFQAMGLRPLEVAATLGASPWDRFRSVALPMARPGLISAAVLGFAHTVGEFGVVLMMGGNIPGQTRVLSVQIYNHVEAGHTAQADSLAAGLLLFSFVILLLLQRYNQRGAELLR